MATRTLSPATRRLVGWLLLISGLLLALGQLIKLTIVAYTWTTATTESLGLLLLYLLSLVGAGLLVRYGRRLLQGGQIDDGPAEGTIL
jgi:hypothetical protein